MKSTRVGAFTILEMLINILIMSIIIGMVYFVYSSFSKQVSFYQKDVEEENGLSSFGLRLKTDFYLAERIVGDANSFSAVFYDTRRIYYEVDNGFLYRTQSGDRDSLKIDKIDISTTVDPLSKESLIKKMQLITVLFGEAVEITLTKKYPNIVDYNTDYGD